MILETCCLIFIQFQNWKSFALPFIISEVFMSVSYLRMNLIQSVGYNKFSIPVKQMCRPLMHFNYFRQYNIILCVEIITVCQFALFSA